MSTPAKLIFNPRSLKPAQRVTREARISEGQEPQAIAQGEIAAYWRGFADGANELGQVHWLESEIDAYYKRTRGL